MTAGTWDESARLRRRQRYAENPKLAEKERQRNARRRQSGYKQEYDRECRRREYLQKYGVERGSLIAFDCSDCAGECFKTPHDLNRTRCAGCQSAQRVPRRIRFTRCCKRCGGEFMTSGQMPLCKACRTGQNPKRCKVCGCQFMAKYKQLCSDGCREAQAVKRRNALKAVAELFLEFKPSLPSPFKTDARRAADRLYEKQRLLSEPARYKRKAARAAKRQRLKSLALRAAKELGLLE